MEKLGQLHRQGDYDLIVVDTPPSRSALDFLDAPDRLSSFLDGRLIKLLLLPAKGPARLMSAGVGLISGALSKILGGQLLRDLQAFVAALDTVFGGFRQRAQQTYALLQAPGTAFIVVAAPEPDALREAAYFVERLHGERMPLAGLVINRATTSPAGELSAARASAAAEQLEQSAANAAAGSHQTQPAHEDQPAQQGHQGEARASAGLTAGLLRLHADRAVRVSRERELCDRFSAAHPQVPVAVLPALATDVHDVDGLREIGELLARG